VPGKPPEFPGPTIVYCPSRKDVEKVHEELAAHGLESVMYHAGLSQAVLSKPVPETRRRIRIRFDQCCGSDAINFVSGSNFQADYGSGSDFPVNYVSVSNIICHF